MAIRLPSAQTIYLLKDLVHKTTLSIELYLKNSDSLLHCLMKIIIAIHKDPVTPDSDPKVTLLN